STNQNDAPASLPRVYLRWKSFSRPYFRQFAFSGSGVVASVSGTKISVKLASIGGPVYYATVIDGIPGPRFAVGKKDDSTPQIINIASGLSDSIHRVEIYRDNEVAEPISVFLGFFDGTIVKTSAPVANYNFEIIGDSLSVGYGILGVEYHPNDKNDPSLHCPRTNENTSWFHTYGAIAARYFNAQVSTVAWSGWGISRGYGGAPDNLIPTIYSTLLGKWSDVSYSFSTTMDVILINLKGNDWVLN
ncbi:hypothetical protein HK100_004089, partial [Physocladia obscura]